ncbi:MAG TPA: aminoacyl-tRNA hydrolase [Casimicrobiaceae bacterium]|nr:aminoacyl-tRNA hydrolase [Casimicrobiaceae bacterium]
MASPLRLFVGLGNPGRRYAATRHNAGAWFVQRLASALSLELRSEARFHSLVGRGRAGDGADFRLALPQSYMNESGQPVAALARYYRIPPAEMLVAYDELDLKPGSVKLKLGGGSAGHNGLKDIVEQLGSTDFWRLRFGIGHPRDTEAAAEVVDYVLHPPRVEEQQAIDNAIDRALAVWSELSSGEIERAMLMLHTRPRSPAAGEGTAAT